MTADVAKLVGLPMLLAAVAGGFAACSGSRELVCNSDTTYLEARSVDPLRIPDDLSAPDETESLRVPDSMPTEDPETEESAGCLDASPAFDQPASTAASQEP